MSESKHTPGPWRASFGELVRVFQKGAPPTVICGVHRIGRNGGERTVTEDEIHANARLIAAAPDLLEALRHAHEALAWYDGLRFEMDGRTAGQAITDAIRKATGEA